MRDPTIARNYAAALIEVAESDDALGQYGDLLHAVAEVLRTEPGIRLLLESPSVTKQTKLDLIQSAFSDVAHPHFVRFLTAVIRRGRQSLLGEISRQYQELLDVKFHRTHAAITIAHQPDAALQERIAARLSEVIGKEVVPHFRVDDRILGGMIVRVGDEVFDGSLRRRLTALRKAMLEGHHEAA